MKENPYAPPGAKIDDASRRRRRGSPWLAVILGWLTDIVGTIVFASIIFTIIGVILGVGGTTGAGAGSIERTGAWQAFGLIFGMCFTTLGGYITARIANANEYRLALVMGLLSLVSGEFLMQMGEGDSSTFWIRLVGLVFTLPAALFGAWLYLQNKHSPAAP